MTICRCAVYTRKSTEHNLDLDFNSLDAQREACEAYIKSQAHEGWRLIPARYDDGGLSGASLDRLALQALLADIGAGRIDIVVVYKVDRLTRSLADFAKLVELFDAHAVSFVSITQSFNTTSSMGRLTLNVLLSFAQFEREVIGERVRDKIAASKRKGLWLGGNVPIGYANEGKKLVVVQDEAETVRGIFRRYLELGSIGALAQDLECRGIRTKQRQLADGRLAGGVRFGGGALAYLLHNRIYVGEGVHRGEAHPGAHEAIVDRGLFAAVQAGLAAQAMERRNRIRGSAAILAGRIFDDRGNRMTPTHCGKRGVRYRYYVSHPLLQKHKHDAGSVARGAGLGGDAGPIVGRVNNTFERRKARRRPGQDNRGGFCARIVNRTVHTRCLIPGRIGCLGYEPDFDLAPLHRDAFERTLHQGALVWEGHTLMLAGLCLTPDESLHHHGLDLGRGHAGDAAGLVLALLQDRVRHVIPVARAALAAMGRGHPVAAVVKDAAGQNGRGATEAVASFHGLCGKSRPHGCEQPPIDDRFVRAGMCLAPMHALPDIDAVVEQIGQSPAPEPDPPSKPAVGKL